MADVANTLAAWSATTNSNQPQGTTTIATGLDDNIREVQGVIVRGLSHKGADIASSTAPALGATEGLMNDITGTVTITGFDTVRVGILKVIKFEGALTLTHNATNLILPGGANITTADGDVGIFISEGSGNWRCLSYSKASGKAVIRTQSTAPTRQILTSGTGATYTTPAGCTYINIRMIGGGGGGGGSSSAGTNGTASTWSGGSLSAGGGTASGAGGTSSNGDINLTGAAGNSTSSSVANGEGACGGSSVFGGAGAAGAGNAGGAGGGGNAAANTGSGGGSGGAGGGVAPANVSGGAGGYLEKLITAPAASYTYTVGAAGSGGSSGANIAGGGNGATGLIIVDESYD